jgi:hypothetical protein
MIIVIYLSLWNKIISMANLSSKTNSFLWRMRFMIYHYVASLFSKLFSLHTPIILFW